MMSEHHDRNYRRFFEDARMVEDLIRGFVHEPWTSCHRLYLWSCTIDRGRRSVAG